LWGGFTTNFLWCAFLNFKNKSSYEYVSGKSRSQDLDVARIPLRNNYFFSAVAGTTWYMQFFFYTMGETQMGRFSFASWTLHMASIIIFGTLWGMYFREWAGTQPKARRLICSGIGLLILSTIVIGYGTWLTSHEGRPTSPTPESVQRLPTDKIGIAGHV
jgi:L-rhamnose-H+ transport protein